MCFLWHQEYGCMFTFCIFTNVIWGMCISHIYIYISEGSAPAAGPSGNQLTADLQIRRISRISKICRIESIGKFSNQKHLSKQIGFVLFQQLSIGSSRFAFRFIDFSRSWGTIFEHFGVLGHYFNTILVTIGCKGSLRRDLECSRVEFYRFSMDLGSPIGEHSGSLFDILSDLKCPKSHLDRGHSF